MFKLIFIRFKWQVLLATILSAASALSGIGMLKIITLQISAMTAQSAVSARPFVWFLLAVSAVLLFGLVSRYLLAKLGAQVVYEFRDSLTRRLLSTPYAMIERIGGHRILAALKTDATKLSEGLLILPEFIYSLITVLLCLSYMSYISGRLFLVSTVLIILLGLIANVFLRYGLRHFKHLRHYEDDLFQGMQMMVDGSQELSINARRRHFVYERVLKANYTDIRQLSVRVALIFTMLNSIGSTLIFFLVGLVVFGSSLYFTDIPADAVVGFVLVILYMIDPVENVISSLSRFSEFAVSYRNVEGLPLTEEAARIESSSHHPLSERLAWQTLKVHQLSFQYHTDAEDQYRFGIGPIDAQFKRGEAVFLTGGNGSGKSTFAKLLVGLYQPDHGQISLDDDIVSETISLTEYQQAFSTIFADFFLFDHVLDEWGNPGDDTVIQNYLTDLELKNKVTVSDGRLSSTNLSSGQKKRLALIMSYYEDTPICVFDEWAADQDPRFRQLFYTEIIPRLKAQNKLVIVITHDDRYFHLADQLIRFDDGQLVTNRSLSADRLPTD
ncbi:cyclic peptide export ABC transporter [Gynuella sunshinyii]|uniref:ABC-type siderophore export system, fused ATPase and permease component n=1 Tax=Gynuella sunshinyii YC6258 TaxID=1445510 RepID=A0A0C5VWF2_9GAMM|nr:cyclic peptide export ABC transporter [Gynuella sunshinyii]AJQ97643.1 ABC-type siderophore export system, fused ATPase and permease component [Gynuella sunshinyii YC6258]